MNIRLPIGFAINRKISIALVLFTLMFSSFAIVGTSGILTQTEVSLTPVTVSTPMEKLTPGAKELLTQGSTPVDMIIQTATSDYGQISALIEDLGGTIKYTYQYIDALAITIPASAILDLAASPLVVKIFEDSLRYLQQAQSRILPEEIVMGTDSGMTAIPVDIEALGSVPSTYVNPTLTKADMIWDDPDVWYGAGVRVAIIDTGCWHTNWTDVVPSGVVPWYWGNVYGGVDISYDAIGHTPEEGYDNPLNHYHGTFVACQLAAHAEVIFSPGHIWGTSMLYWWPDGNYEDAEGIHIFCSGVAPLAEIFAVKVFDHTGGGVPSSMVMEGIDLAIAEGVDIISMSLGGGCGAPGQDPSDLLVDAATAAGITVVVAAGNEGPAPLRVGSPGTARSVITVGAAIDPIHHRVRGSISLWPYFAHPAYGYYYYPHDEYSVAYFSSRGPTSDGRVKPDVVATGYDNFGQLTPALWPYTIARAGGTSFSCPIVAGEAALLKAYIINNGLDLGPKEIKKAIMEGADPIEGFSDFEQGAGYINCYQSLEILKDMESDDDCGFGCGHDCRFKHGHYKGLAWFPPIDMLRLKDGKVTVNDITLDPLKFEYFAFWVTSQADSVRITLSGVEFAPVGDQNPLFGDSAYLYLSGAAREGVDDYLIPGGWFYDADPAAPDEWVFQVSSDFVFEPGLVRLVFEGDWTSYEPIHIEQMTIEVVSVAAFKCGRHLGIMNFGVDVEEAQVSIYDGLIETEKGKIKEGEKDAYAFTIPDASGIAIVELSWRKDWTRWATSDLDMIIYGPYGVNTDGVTGASPEVALVIGPGDYLIEIEGYQVYFNKNEHYTLRIIYFADLSMSKWDSAIFALDHWFSLVKLPKKMHGVAVVWIHDTLFNSWYMADYVEV
ncbi:MAG: S8 family serine peptidase [Candidatus Hodarchaeota archaeon]